MRRFAFFAPFALVASLLVSTRAHATQEFPQQIVTDQNITCANPIFDGSGCTICHTDNNGGLGTATKPFGVWAKSNGLQPFGDQKLAALLTQLQNESPHATDTNCDGTPDIDELTNCQWAQLAVNQCGVGDAGTPDGGLPVTIYYGCQASPNVGDGGGPALPACAALAILGMLAAATIRARTRKR